MVPVGLLLQLVQLFLLCPALQGAHHPIPAPGLQQTERKGVGLNPALHPAPILRRASQNPTLTLTLTLMMKVVAAQHLKMVVSLRERVRWVLMVEPDLSDQPGQQGFRAGVEDQAAYGCLLFGQRLQQVAHRPL